jgi:hypothetical protein
MKIFLLTFLFGLQVFANAPPPVVWGSGPVVSFLAPLQSHIEVKGAAPTSVTSCGSNPSIVGNDSVGTITVGTGGIVASCVLNFSGTWTNVPKCFVSNRSAIIALQVVPAATTLTVTAALAFAASSVLDYFCVGYK